MLRRLCSKDSPSVLQIFEYASGTHAAANTHGHEPIFCLTALELAQQGCHQLGARATKRMTERDGAPFNVDAPGIDAERLDDSERLCGKGLVELDYIDLVERKAGHSEGLGNGVYGTYAHLFGIASRVGE